MTTFTPVPRDLYRQAEPEAGEILPALTGRFTRDRPVEVFAPDWDYLLTGRASTVAVVAALHCGEHDPPDHAWPEVMRLYCPTAWQMLADADITFEQWYVGDCEAVLRNRIAAAANTELGDYAVFVMVDVPAMVAEIIGTLGAVPTFTDPGRRSVRHQDNQ
ncbi:hypothetical protein [Amycolatopsis sp. CA-230715]|uniref:hypothetical protein n=1 Tax=Amycolatopsis sp. CA-230715 TaxID=2745196 RepID=UPI001C0319F9|nr:hypothetical protein [Amycolatopsis sp. CA-230715]QWF85768.1 hypothetical protein HUW46_09248 [Amycolatopsis sp. CA-230715]